MSRYLWLSAALLAAVPAMAQETATDAPAFTTPADVSADTVVATVGGTDITLGHMIVLRNTLPQQYLDLPDDVLYKGILDQLVQQEALVQSLGAPARPDLLRVENDRRGYLSNVALLAAVAGAVTDEALQAAYDAKYANAPVATEYNAAHILVATREEADAIKAELDAGADFATLAAERSTDGAAANGGDLGWFGPGADGFRLAPDPAQGDPPGDLAHARRGARGTRRRNRAEGRCRPRRSHRGRGDDRPPR
jgi:parvulin-like peptidyl-prolyl isomerase